MQPRDELRQYMHRVCANEVWWKPDNQQLDEFSGLGIDAVRKLAWREYAIGQRNGAGKKRTKDELLVLVRARAAASGSAAPGRLPVSSSKRSAAAG